MTSLYYLLYATMVTSRATYLNCGSHKRNLVRQNYTNIESPRYVIVTLHTDRKNFKTKNIMYFDNIGLSDIKLYYLNSLLFTSI